MPLQKQSSHGFLAWMAAVFLIAGAFWMLPHGRLHDFGTVPWFLLGASVMLGGFFLALRFPPQASWMYWAVAVGVRLILVFQAPCDDIYRYVWEGRILIAGWNPYLHAPNAVVLEPLRDGLWPAVQHKGFTAIYPPLAQWVMAILSTISTSLLFYKAVFALADLAVAVLLVKRFGRSESLFYAWNPLVIYSFAGGGHYDSLFILAMVMGWLAWKDGRRLRAAGWLGAAVAVKWLALPLLAWVGWRLLMQAWKTRQWGDLSWAGLVAGLPWILSYASLSLWTGEWTLQLHPAQFSQHARSAELIPGVVGWLWEESKTQNQWLVIPLAVGWTFVILREREFVRAAEWMFFVAYVLTPMLHAWYFTWILPFAVATRNKGVIAVTASAFVYFMVYHHVEAPKGAWMLMPWETALLWFPFVVGFLWSAYQKRAGEWDLQ